MDFATPQVFANARDEPNNDPNRGQKLEIKTYESRYNSQGNPILLSTGTNKGNWTRAEPEEHTHSALLVTRFYDKNKELEYTEMEVRSPYIRAALRSVIKTYPGLTFDTGKILIRNEPRCIFHYRNELRDYGMRLEDQTAAQHLVFFLNYMYSSLRRETSSYYTFMESPAVVPGIEHEFLWMAFKPGCLLLHTQDGVHKILRLVSMSYVHFRGWRLDMEKIAYDGEVFGRVSECAYIRWYDGYRPLQELKVYPLQFHPHADEIRQALTARGREYVRLKEYSHRSYFGVANSLSPYRTVDDFGDEEYRIDPITIKGRVIIDFKKFGRYRPSFRHNIPTSKTFPVDLNGDPILTNEDLCMFDSEVHGYSLSAKRWCFFEMDRITRFEYNTRAFESLVLPAEQKTMLTSLANVHTEDSRFDDLIEGKSKGLIFLLHGEPGVGKTLTAENLSDYTKRPLYSVSCGNLGTTAAECEKALIEVLDLASSWNAILLIDEADVFLEQRSVHDLVRNGCVAAFLRLLEYYEGIMFLTTNRIMNFDVAFKSRIHLAIKYPGLSASSQRQLWMTFITNNFKRPEPSWLTAELLDDLETKGLNGRQIKNAVRTAMSLAIGAQRELEPEDIWTSLQAMEDFERDIAEAKKWSYTLEDGHNMHGDQRDPSHGTGPKRRRLA